MLGRPFRSSRPRFLVWIFQSSLLLIMAGIVSVGGLVPTHTQIDDQCALVHHAGTGQHAKASQMKHDLLKILGSCMDYSVPVMDMKIVPRKRVNDLGANMPGPVPALDRTVPRPPSA